MPPSLFQHSAPITTLTYLPGRNAGLPGSSIWPQCSVACSSSVFRVTKLIDLGWLGQAAARTSQRTPLSSDGASGKGRRWRLTSAWSSPRWHDSDTGKSEAVNITATCCAHVEKLRHVASSRNPIWAQPVELGFLSRSDKMKSRIGTSV